MLCPPLCSPFVTCVTKWNMRLREHVCVWPPNMPTNFRFCQSLSIVSCLAYMQKGVSKRGSSTSQKPDHATLSHNQYLSLVCASNYELESN